MSQTQYQHLSPKMGLLPAKKGTVAAKMNTLSAKISTKASAAFLTTSLRASSSGLFAVPGMLLLLTVPESLIAASKANSPQVEIYGRADISIDYYHGTDEYSTFDLANNSSRVGIKGAYQLDTGLNLLAQAEQAIELNRGNGGNWSSRNTYLGLEDDWGMIRFGYMDSVLKDLRSKADLFSSHMGDSRNILRGPHNPHFDARMPSSVRYTSPEQQGWGVDVQYSFDTGDYEEDDQENPADANQFRAYSAMLSYRGAGFWVALGHEQYDGSEQDPTDPQAGERRTGEGSRLGLGVDIGEALTLNAVAQLTQDSFPYYQDPATDDDPEGYKDAVGGGLGLKYRLAQELEVLGQYYTIDAERSGYAARMTVLGAVYHADARTRLFATAATINNSQHSSMAPWVHGRTAGPKLEDTSAKTGATTWGLSSGVRFDF